MKKFQKFTSVTKYFFLVALISTSTLFVSCSDNTTDPTVDNSVNQSSLLLGDDRNPSDKDKIDDRNKESDKNFKGIPIDCFKLTQEQMAKYKELMSQRERDTKLAKDEFNKASLEIRMAEKESMGNLLSEERDLRNKLKELSRSDANTDSRNQFRELQRAAKAKIELIRQSEKEESKVIMTKVRNEEITKEEARVLLQELRTRTKAQIDVIMLELREAKAKLENTNIDNPEVTRIKSRLQEIKTALDTIRQNTKSQLEPLEIALKEKLNQIENNFRGAFREMLDERQQAMFDEWVRTGKRPC